MRKYAIAAAVVLVLAVAAAGFLLFRGPATPAALASYLPNKDGTLLYINVDALRKSGILGMLAGSKAAEDAEYKDFVSQTGFDYRHDLDSVAATFRGGQSFFAVKGQFDWRQLEAYFSKHGGSCRGSYCAMTGSQPDRRISFHKLRSNLMALAVSPDEMAAFQVTRNASTPPFIPSEPIWMLAPAAVLKEADALPSGLRAFAIALEGADRAVFTIGPEQDHFAVSINVNCANAGKASDLLTQLESTTNLLRKMLAREHREPNPGDLSGVLVAGTFRQEDSRVLGQWPVQRVFLDAIANSARP